MSDIQNHELYVHQSLYTSTQDYELLKKMQAILFISESLVSIA